MIQEYTLPRELYNLLEKKEFTKIELKEDLKNDLVTKFVKLLEKVFGF